MASINTDDCDGDCRRYHLGHQIHFIQARKAHEYEPLEAIVGGLDGHRVTLLYVESGLTEVVWHHRSLGQFLTIGQPVGRRAYGILVLRRSHLLSVRHDAGWSPWRG